MKSLIKIRTKKHKQSPSAPKFIIVTGGVISGIGKGITSSSIGFLFSENYKVVPIKLDGYLNVDPGTMNPIEHGEVFVLDDGSEVDMDFGHYERFINCKCSNSQSITMGKIYDEIRQKERRGDYLGKTVQLIPHVSDLIQEKFFNIAKKSTADIVLIEIGGTVGDLENDLFLEAVRQLEKKVGQENICFVHLSYVPIPYGVNEQKTKPTQQSVNLLQSKGIWPDFIVCRCETFLEEKIKEKIALFANLNKENIFSAPDISSVYKIPYIFSKQKFIDKISKKLNLKKPNNKRLITWENLLNKKKVKKITILIAGKYTDLEDAYASVIEALKHCEYNFGVNIKIDWLDTSKKLDYNKLKNSHGVIVPGGFGSRGAEGKIKVIKYVRENKIPYLGICYGLQLSIIEFTRNICKLKDSNSFEIDLNTKNPVITLLDEQKKVVSMGGSMRLGSYGAKISDGIIKHYYTKLKLISPKNIIFERHRHRYEVNPFYKIILEDKGMKISGIGEKRDLVEFIELDRNIHPYFVATQAHPELKSKLDKPAPLFYGLVENAINFSKK